MVYSYIHYRVYSYIYVCDARLEAWPDAAATISYYVSSIAERCSTYAAEVQARRKRNSTELEPQRHECDAVYVYTAYDVCIYIYIYNYVYICI